MAVPEFLFNYRVPPKVRPICLLLVSLIDMGDRLVDPNIFDFLYYFLLI